MLKRSTSDTLSSSSVLQSGFARLVSLVVVMGLVLASLVLTSRNASAKPVGKALPGTGFPHSAKVLKTLAVEARAKAGEKDSSYADSDMIVLSSEAHFTVSKGFVSGFRYHRVTQVNDRQAVASLGDISWGYAPWRQKPSHLDAQVLDAKGKVHRLDQKLVTDETGAQGGDDHTYSDWRQVKAPLPAVHPGAIVESLVIEKSFAGFSDSGAVQRWYLQSSRPILHSRVIIDSDSKLRPEVLMPSGSSDRAPRITSKKRGSGYRYTIERRGLEALEYEWNTPSDEPPMPTLYFSTGSSWNRVAREYEAIAERQIKAGPLPASLPLSVKASRAQSIASALAELHKRVRYTGLELGENARVPWTPAETWKREFGDCKDKVTVLVAMLRKLGIQSHLALVRSGSDLDVHPQHPGSDHFNHAIVYVPKKGKEPAYWIDATVELAGLGQIPFSIQGRKALIASKSTKKLTTIPVGKAGDNRVREQRNIGLVGYGSGRVEEVSYFYGSAEIAPRYNYRDSAKKDLKDRLESYMIDHYGAKEMTSMDFTDPSDLAKPLEVRLKASETGYLAAGTHTAEVSINRYQLFDRLSSDLTSLADERKSLRSRMEPRKFPLATWPSLKEWQYRVEFPESFRVKTLPRDMVRKLGAVRFEQKFRVKGDVLEANFSVRLDATTLSASEVNKTRKALATFLDDSRLDLIFHHESMSLYDRGFLKGAVAEVKRAIAAAKTMRDKADEQARLAKILAEIGLTLEGYLVAKEASATSKASQLAAEEVTYALEARFASFFGGPAPEPEELYESYEQMLAREPGNKRFQSQLASLYLDDLETGALYEGPLERALPHLQRVADQENASIQWRHICALFLLERDAELVKLANAHENTDAYRVGYLLAVYLQKGKEALLKEATNARYDNDLRDSLLSILRGLGRFEVAAPLAEIVYKGDKEQAWQAGELQSVAAWAKRSGDKSASATVREWIALRLRGEKLPKSAISSALDLVAPGKRQPDFDALKGAYSTRNYFTRPALADAVAALVRVEEKITEGPYTRLKITDTNEGSYDLVVEKRGRGFRFVAFAGNDQGLIGAMEAAVKKRDYDVAHRLLTWHLPEGHGPVPVSPVGDDVLWSWGSTSAVWHDLRDEPTTLRLECTVLAARMSLGTAFRGLKNRYQRCLKTESVHLASMWFTYRLQSFQRAELSAKHFAGDDAQIQRMASWDADAAVVAKLLQTQLYAALGRREQALASLRAIDLDALRPRFAWGQHAAIAQMHCKAGEFKLCSDASARAYEAFPTMEANNFVWNQLFVEDRTEEAETQLADAAGLLDSMLALPWGNFRHTSAAWHAFQGENQKALSLMMAANRDFQGHDWLIVGRVLANLGLTGRAKVAYRKAINSSKVSYNANSTAKLAEQWLAKLEAPSHDS